MPPATRRSKLPMLLDVDDIAEGMDLFDLEHVLMQSELGGCYG
jgi:hypothetical protein